MTQPPFAAIQAPPRSSFPHGSSRLSAFRHYVSRRAPRPGRAERRWAGRQVGGVRRAARRCWVPRRNNSPPPFHPPPTPTV